MQDSKVFIVDNDIEFSSKLEFQIRKEIGCDIIVFQSGDEAVENLIQQPIAIVCNYFTPDLDSSSLLKKVKAFDSNIAILVYSPREDINLALKLLKKGINDFVVKDEIGIGKLVKSVKSIIEKSRLKRELSSLKLEIKNKYKLENLIGKGDVIQKVYSTIAKIVDSKINISLHGEPGTGKEVLAKTIHYNSKRKNEAFISVNLESISDDNFELSICGREDSEDRNNNKSGIFERAHKGTIYITGFERICSQKQALLQKVLQTKELTKIGAANPVAFDFRLIMSYDFSLDQMLSQKMINQQLYFKSMGVPINIPPLRERENDITLLAKEFVSIFAAENNLNPIVFSPEALKKLKSYKWPGNIQELKSVVEVAAVLCNNSQIEESDISFNSVKNLNDFLSEEKTLKEFNRGIIKHFMDKYQDNVLLVADKLDIGKSTIYRMIKNNEL